MTDAAAPATPRLWTPSGFREDGWSRGEGAELSGGCRAILPLQALLGLDGEARRTARGRLGVILEAGEALDPILPVLGDLALVALDFPRFNDGRSFSKAELLRSRYRFKGALRAAGEVLIDQIPLMLRVGFDEFEVSNAVALARLDAGRLNGIPFTYQPAARASGRAGKYSWRHQA